MGNVHKSTVATELLTDEPHLQTANTTRRNSQMKTIRSALRTSEEKLCHLDVPNLVLFYLNDIPNNMVILAPYEKVTDYVQQQNSHSLGYVLTRIWGLQFHLNKMTSKHNSGFVETMRPWISECPSMRTTA